MLGGVVQRNRCMQHTTKAIGGITKRKLAAPPAGPRNILDLIPPSSATCLCLTLSLDPAVSARAAVLQKGLIQCTVRRLREVFIRRPFKYRVRAFAESRCLLIKCQRPPARHLLLHPPRMQMSIRPALRVLLRRAMKPIKPIKYRLRPKQSAPKMPLSPPLLLLPLRPLLCRH
jgi:hypothetical protein